MKKFILLMLIAVTCAATASSQITRTESRSITKIEKNKDHFGYNFLVKAGAGFMRCDEEDLFKYGVVFVFQKQFMNNGLYWGGQAGLNSFSGGKMFYETYWYYYMEPKSRPAISASPILGIKCPIYEKISLDVHAGLGYAYVFNFEENSRLMWEVGVGLWFKKFLVELEYQGANSFDSYRDDGLLVNVGMRF